MKAYLVTGGWGVIGSCIARRLLEAGNHVGILDSCEEPRNQWTREKLGTKVGNAFCDHFPRRIEHIDHDTLTRLVDSADAVIHCAASTGIPYSVGNPADDWERNVDGTRALLNAVRATGKPTVVLSSVKPYRVPTFLGQGLSESEILEPDEPYAASKAAQSMLCMSYARSYELPIVTFRCSNLYGPGACHGPRHGWLTWFCISAAIGRPIEVQGTGNQRRDMLYADDVFSACMLALDHARELRGEVYNLGGGLANVISVGEAASALSGASGAKVVSGPARAMDDDAVWVDYKKFAMATGWHPEVDVEDGMERVYQWAKANADDLRELYKGV